MPPSADQILQMRNLMQAYKVQLRSSVARHKSTVNKIMDEADRRKTKKLLEKLGKVT